MQGYKKEWRPPRSPLTPTGNVVAIAVIVICFLLLLSWAR